MTDTSSDTRPAEAGAEVFTADVVVVGMGIAGVCAAIEAAEAGAENSRNFPSKFGRAKSYGDKTIGTPDAGAVSMARFFKGLAEA